MLGFPTATHTTILLAVPPRMSILTLLPFYNGSQVHFKYCKHACTPERENDSQCDEVSIIQQAV